MTIHTKAAWQKEGATCAEAFERTVDPAHQQSMRLPVQRITVRSRDDGIGGHNFDRNQNERERANRLARASCVGFLRTGVLIATGHLSFFNSKEGSIGKTSTVGAARARIREIGPVASPVLPRSGDDRHIPRFGNLGVAINLLI